MNYRCMGLVGSFCDICGVHIVDTGTANNIHGETFLLLRELQSYTFVKITRKRGYELAFSI